MRILLIVCSVAVTLAGAAWTLVRFGSPTATESGSALYPHRIAQAVLEKSAEGLPPTVVWLGDSTMMGGGSYPMAIQRSILRRHRLRSAVVAYPGLDAYAFHSLIHDVMSLRPRVVVLIANLRVFSNAKATTTTFDDLTACVPTEALPRLFTLPFYFRGMTAPGLLLTRVLRYEWARDAFFWVQGTRDEIQHAAAWAMLGPEEPTAASSPARALVKGWSGLVRTYNAPITPRSPLVRFFAASVAALTDAGIQALVLVTPIPYEALAAAGHYDSRAFAGRIDVLRRAVEAEGGVLLDLHDALPRALFRDRSGHFTVEGNERMQQLVWPTLARLLGVSPLFPRYPPPSS